MSNPGTSEWTCKCKDCPATFRYSDTNYQANQKRGFSRPERCVDCRRQHAKEVNTVGQPYFKVKPLLPGVRHEDLVSPLGRLHHAPRPHRAEHVTPKGEAPDKFGIKDDKIVEMFRWFAQDQGLQVVVVVGPTGSGKSTYFPYRLVHPPRTYVTYEPDPENPGSRREVLGADGKPLPFDASDVPADLFHRYGQIVVTQPRIQATRNIPAYIARAMLGSSLGAGFDIGYQYAKNPASDWRSKLRFCTDGSMINWIATGQLDKINTVMIDEAHERSLNIDIIIGLLTQALPRYPRLKLIIASATISADLFINHFNNHLPRRAVRELRIGEDTKVRRKLDDVTKTVDAPERIVVAPNTFAEQDRRWFLKPADNCELMEFDGKAFRVDPHFYEEEELEYAFLDPSARDPARVDAVERKLRKFAKTAHEKVAAHAIGLLEDMYLTPEQLVKGDGIRRTQSLDPDGNKPKEEQQTPGWRREVDITERRGDILCFLHGEQSILDCCKLVKAAQPNLKRCRVEALPLFTQLPQSEQDKALLERKPSVHDDLVERIVRFIDAGETDILAHSDNVGAVVGLQFETVEKMVAEAMAKRWGIEKDRLKDTRDRLLVQRWSSFEAVNLGSPCTPKAGKKLEPRPSSVKGSGVRVVVASSRALAVWKAPYENATDGTRVTLNGESFCFVTQKKERRRVVVSTNVAETSLTIHGILHVVDSGLINQNKWMPETETTGIRAIVQSRAGCKQRWGRAGRLQAGDAWPLYSREQFGLDSQVTEPPGVEGDPRCFPYYSTPEIRRSPLEQILLTAKKAGLESLDVNNFPWLEPPDPKELERAAKSLHTKGALDEAGRLTEHGLELTAFQSEAALANLMVVADRMACAVEMATVLAVLKVGAKKLFLNNNDWDEPTRKRVQQMQASLTVSCGDDLEMVLKVVATWEIARAAGQALADLVRWNADWPAVLSGEPDRSSVDLLTALGRAASQDEVSALRRAASVAQRTVVDRHRNKIAAGIKARRAWLELKGHWETITKLEPAWREAWAAAVDPLRVECLADELLTHAIALPPESEFLATLARIEARARTPAAPDPAPDVEAEDPAAAVEEAAQAKADAEASRLADVQKFLASVAGIVKKYDGGMPARGTRRKDAAGGGADKPDPDVEGAWRSLDALGVSFVKSLDSRLRTPVASPEAERFLGAVEGATTLEQFEALKERSAWVKRVLEALPAACARAWCAYHYVDEKVIGDKDKIDAARSELIDALSGHKKEDERRPLNLALLNRLRLIFARALPNQCYARSGKVYAPVVPGDTPFEAVIEQDSVCNADPPALFVCMLRRAMPAGKSGDRKLGAGMIVRLDLPELGLSPDVIRGGAGVDPLAKWSVFQLASALPRSADRDEAGRETRGARARLLLDQRFVLQSEWTFVLSAPVADRPGDWRATAELNAVEKSVPPRYRGDTEPDEALEEEGGGDFTQSTFADEYPEPVYDADAAGAEPGRRALLLNETATVATPLGERVREQDQDREAAAIREADEAADAGDGGGGGKHRAGGAGVPSTTLPAATATVRIRLVPGVRGAEPKIGDRVRAWVARIDADPEPTVVVNRRKLAEILGEIKVDTEREVEVVGRAPGARAGVRVRIVGTEAEASLTARDLGFRDDDGAANIILKAWHDAGRKLGFKTTVWEVDPAEGVLRLTTLPQVLAWWAVNGDKPPTKGRLLRSSPGVPDRVSVLVHAEPAKGLVIIAETNAAQFPGTPDGGEVDIHLSRNRDARRSPSVKKFVQLTPEAAALGLQVKDGKSNYLGEGPMSLETRAQLLQSLASTDAARRVVNGLFEQSNAWFAENAAVGRMIGDLARVPEREMCARVVEVNQHGAALEALDPTNSVLAGVRLRLRSREYERADISSIAPGKIVVVRPTGKAGGDGQLEVSLQPTVGSLTAGVPAGIAGISSGLHITNSVGVTFFCDVREIFPNITPTPEELAAIVEHKTPRVFEVRAPKGDRPDVTVSQRRAAVWALRCRYPNIVNECFRGMVSGVTTLPPNEKRPDEMHLADVNFGSEQCARCPVHKLGIGFGDQLIPAIEELLRSGPFPVNVMVTGWRDENDGLQISGRPAVEASVSHSLVGKVVTATVIDANKTFLLVRLTPLIYASCYRAEVTVGRFDNPTGIFAPGTQISVLVLGMNEKGHLQVSRRQAILAMLSSTSSAGPFKGMVVGRDRDNAPIVELAPGVVGTPAYGEYSGPTDNDSFCDVSVEIRPDPKWPWLRLTDPPRGSRYAIRQLGEAPGQPADVLLRSHPATRGDLAALFDKASSELLDAVLKVETALWKRDLDVARDAIRALRLAFPASPNAKCPFEAREALIRRTHDEYLKRGQTATAREIWPTSPVVPPEPPGALRAAVVHGYVALKWAASPSPANVAYRVSRAGQILQDNLRACEFVDLHAPRGKVLTYQVAAIANAKLSEPIRQQITVPGDVTDLLAAASSGQVRISWRMPEAAKHVEIWRKHNNVPLARHDGQFIVATTSGEHIDTDLPNDQLFGYRLVVVYSNAASEGLAFEAIPSANPSAIVLPKVPELQPEHSPPLSHGQVPSKESPGTTVKVQPGSGVRTVIDHLKASSTNDPTSDGGPAPVKRDGNWLVQRLKGLAGVEPPAASAPPPEVKVPLRRGRDWLLSRFHAKSPPPADPPADARPDADS